MFEANLGNAGARWQLIRLRQGCSSEITIVSRSFFCLTTHFVRVTIPCAVDGCALCEMLPSRGLFYLGCLCQGRLSLLELGAFSANDFEQHAKLLHGGLRPGLVFRVSRRGGKQPIHSECIQELPAVSEVSLMTLAQRVLAIYKFPCANPDELIEQYEERIRRIALRRNEHLAAQLLKSPASGF